jgi:hypothetical protein
VRVLVLRDLYILPNAMPHWVLCVLGFIAEGKSGRHITPTLEKYQTICLRILKIFYV